MEKIKQWFSDRKDDCIGIWQTFENAFNWLEFLVFGFFLIIGPLATIFFLVMIYFLLKENADLQKQIKIYEIDFIARTQQYKDSQEDSDGRSTERDQNQGTESRD